MDCYFKLLKKGPLSINALPNHQEGSNTEGSFFQKITFSKRAKR
jgi:hypothetical protein